MKKFYLALLISALMMSSFWGCKKQSANSGVNPYEADTVLECRNLKVRKIELGTGTNLYAGEKVVRVFIENLCKSCDKNKFPIYDIAFMIERRTGDTLAFNKCFCLSPPPNNSTSEYELKTALNVLPDPRNIRFIIHQTCQDIAYERR